MESSHRRSEAGMALLMALFYISIAVIVLAALFGRLMQQRLNVDHFEINHYCFQGLEAAIASSKVEFEGGEDGIIGMDNWTPAYDANNSFVFPDFDGGVVTPITLSSMPGVQFCSYGVDWFTDNRDTNGDGIVDSTAERWKYTVYAMARNQGTVRRAEVVYGGSDINVWRNAIFAGAGQAGGLINGNVSIHGSVHLLGDHLLQGAAAIAALDMSGASLIHNNYGGVPATLQARVPALPQTLFNGETIGTLEAKLRVKRGLVSMSGNSEVGEPDVVGNSYKETMDGTYITDGWTGNSVLDDGGRGDPSSVFSDNGWDEGYDLGDKVSLPLLTDDWRDPNDGSKIVNPNTGTWYTHEDYFSQVLLAAPDNPTDGVYNGNITLNAHGNKFYWNASTNTVMNGSLPAALPPADQDYIYFDPTTNVLRINGQIRINGTLSLVGQGGDRTINYSGRAAILAYGDVTIDCDLLSCNNGNPANVINSFPQNNIIGVMTATNMVVGSTAQCDIMGAFYAQNMLKSEKQTDVMGTFVSNYFDMGSQVPNIYQVPALADNLPLGMIGNFPILALSRVSWRELPA